MTRKRRHSESAAIPAYLEALRVMTGPHGVKANLGTPVLVAFANVALLMPN
jgi:hypothetical protein